MKDCVFLVICFCVAVVATGSALSADITQAGDVVSVRYHIDDWLDWHGCTIQLYHLDYGYPVAVAEWDATGKDGSVSVDLQANKIPATTFYSRIVKYNEEGDVVEQTNALKPWWWFWS